MSLFTSANGDLTFSIILYPSFTFSPTLLMEVVPLLVESGPF